jgi:hypothetical protein
VNSIRELIVRDVDGDSLKRKRLEHVAESISDAIRCTASGAVAVRASALVPLLKEVSDVIRRAVLPYKVMCARHPN